jgi:hypothetical protein
MNPPIARQLNLDETKLPAEIFERLSRRGATLKDYRRRREEAIENFGKPGRDPAELGSVMTTIAGNGVWAANIVCMITCRFTAKPWMCAVIKLILIWVCVLISKKYLTNSPE